MVSARDGYGSVNEAIQNIVRHLLASKYGVSKWKPKNVKKEEKKARELEYEGLQMIEIAKFDDVFNMANMFVKKVAMLRDYHDISLNKIRELCLRYHLIESSETSLEDFMLAIQSNIDEGATIKVCFNL